jgi:hypothetical protein
MPGEEFQPPRDEIKTIDKQRLDQISRFLQPTIPKGEEERYRILKPLIGKEMSMGNIMRDDMNANDYMNYGIQELFLFGQEDLGFTFLTNFLAEFKMTMSIDAIMIESLTKSKMEYAQTYTVHEHQHNEPGPRRGLLGGRK